MVSVTEKFVVVQGNKKIYLGPITAIKLGVLKTGNSNCVDTVNTSSKNQNYMYQHFRKK